MEIKRAGSRSSGKGPADWFTGTVRIDPLFSVPDSRIVIQKRLDGSPVDWMEQVSDAQYRC